MGFHEDDRIRRKNATYDEAWNLVNTLRGEGFTAQDILSYVSQMDVTGARNEVSSMVLRIIRSPHYEKSVGRPSVSG